MPDPTIISCTTGEWTKVATNVVSGVIWKINYSARYYQTYRLTGGSAPTNLSEAVPMFQTPDENYEEIRASQGIDIYVYCKVRDGSVRVDV